MACVATDDIYCHNPEQQVERIGVQNLPRSGDYRVEVKVTLEQFYNGAEQTFTINREVVCRACRGTGARNAQTVKCKGNYSFGNSLWTIPITIYSMSWSRQDSSHSRTCPGFQCTDGGSMSGVPWDGPVVQAQVSRMWRHSAC